MGLEPTTTRLKGVRSTDWANRVLRYTLSHISEDFAARSGVRTHAHYAPGLKSGSLDHSDIRAFEQFYDLLRSVYLLFLFLFCFIIIFTQF